MIVYNVTIKLAHSIAADYLAWLKTEHIPELMQTGLFKEHQIFRLLEHDDEEGTTYIIQYFLDSMKEYERYIADYAPQAREKGYKKFGDKFIAFRTLMEAES